jgi:hypothetical protein
MSEHSAPVSAQTGWPNLLPPGVLAEWKKADPEAPKVLLREVAADAKFLRRMAWARLISAVLLFAGSLALSAYFVHQQAIIGGTITAGAGTMTVVTILLTGRPPVPRRK